jgi:hypothetical protein
MWEVGEAFATSVLYLTYRPAGEEWGALREL